ncbi:MAG: GTPase ObgE [Chlamydiia bacterium]|nr:GTPase ObgE [Chlamydiia bacterium]
MFVDRVRIRIQAGKGGDGLVSWRREKYIPKGGPYGGDGGRGGDVVFACDPHLSSLDWFLERPPLKAENGAGGGSNNCTGRGGSPLTLKLPPGTSICDPETGECLFDLVSPEQSWVACRGGKGGYGNSHFKSPTRRAPNFATPGQEGEERELILELKLIADIGLIGFPNAGKSTLLHHLSNAKVKIAAYPFTTLHPNLGTLAFDQAPHSLTLADIPGIIEGAHSNRGLGLKFLRHIERTRLLLFVLDASGSEGRTPLEDLAILLSELEHYSPELLKRPALYLLNKIDEEASEELIREFFQYCPVDADRVLQASAELGIGTDELKSRLQNEWSQMMALRDTETIEEY